MAETEVDEIPEQVDAPAVSGEEAPVASNSLKERIKRPNKPDETELKVQTGLLNDEIQKAKARIEQIKEEIGNKTSSRQKGSDEQQRVKNQLSELRNHFQAELVSDCTLLAVRRMPDAGSVRGPSIEYLLACLVVSATICLQVYSCRYV